MVSYQEELLAELDQLLKVEWHQADYATFEGLRFLAAKLSRLLREQGEGYTMNDETLEILKLTR